MNRGKLAILAMFLLACVLGLVSVGYHSWASHGVLAWWGGDLARLVADAPQAEALELQPLRAGQSSQPNDTLTIGGRTCAVGKRKNVSAASGLDHLRRGLLDHGNFVWPAQLVEPADTWTDALVFGDGTRRATVLFDFANHRVGRPDAATVLAIDKIASGWQDFFNDVLPPQRNRTLHRSKSSP